MVVGMWVWVCGRICQAGRRGGRLRSPAEEKGCRRMQRSGAGAEGSIAGLPPPAVCCDAPHQAPCMCGGSSSSSAGRARAALTADGGAHNESLGAHSHSGLVTRGPGLLGGPRIHLAASRWGKKEGGGGHGSARAGKGAVACRLQRPALMPMLAGHMQRQHSRQHAAGSTAPAPSPCGTPGL